jgi:3-isopropylmalate dehydratase small subunit
MEPFTRLKSLAAPLPEANIDTDIIFPARFLVVTAKKGLGRYAFYERRRRADGSEDPDFVLNQPRYAGAQILIAGDNFGGGSSREQAPWALHDLGFRCIISTRFGEIFQANCFKNGMVAASVAADARDQLMQDAEAGRLIEVDLQESCIRRHDGQRIDFTLPAWRREALLNGWDEIALVIRHDGDHIAAFEQAQRAERPWLYQGE